ncbi:MAG: DUF1640 domain-containing protein [Nitrospirae bacterium]|nr:DUF1640 domain-containing protein [Nitrospirota bacterium]MBF0591421.1 DUF1640 domain-containing protein [Nitrospirota bacterium]
MKDTLIFDTHTYVKRLKAAGFTEEQAEVQAESMSSLIEEGLATKRDLKELETSLKRDMKELETSLKRDMKELETSLRHNMKELETSLRRDMKELETSFKRDIKELELRLSIRLGTIMAAGIAAIAVLMRLFPH